MLPNFQKALDALLHTLVQKVPELEHVDVARILSVRVSAHGLSVASVRDLRSFSKSVKVGGHVKDIELALRPRFFLEGNAAKRAATLVHELLHVGAPLGLNERMSHANISTKDMNVLAVKCVERLIAKEGSAGFACLGHQGWASMQEWKTRPISNTAERAFSDDDLTLSHVCFHTPESERSGWW